MTDFKLVLSTPDGKSYQKELKSPQADTILQRKIGDILNGDSLGFAGYEFQVTGGSDKAGFPMRKGIVTPRKKIFTGKGVGFSGKNRLGEKQPGLGVRKTVCGEMITPQIFQVNLKVLKEGAEKLSPVVENVPAETAKA